MKLNDEKKFIVHKNLFEPNPSNKLMSGLPESKSITEDPKKEAPKKLV